MWKRFKSWFRYEKHRPTAPRSFGDWTRFYDQYRKAAPVRYFLNIRLKQFGGNLRRRVWDLQHRFHPKYQCHIVRTNLKPGYYDKDEIMLNAVFTLVQRFVEEELNQNPKSKNPKEEGLKALDNMINECRGEFEVEHRKAYEDLREIYLWWKDEYPKRPDVIGDSLIVTDDPLMFGSRDDEPVLLEYIRWFRIKHDYNADQIFEKRTDEMLEKAVKIRKFLWT